jgi:hypothetical protein
MAKAATDTITVRGLGGADTISADKLTAGNISLVVEAGEGNDTVAGGHGNDHRGRRFSRRARRHDVSLSYKGRRQAGAV